MPGERKQNLVNGGFSELYAYDTLNRLTSMDRGTLNTAKDAIVGTPTRSQDWSLDALGNSQSITTDGTPVGRTHNAQNQLTQVGSSPLASDWLGAEGLWRWSCSTNA